MKEGETKFYYHFAVYRNQWDEYCVVYPRSRKMVAYNASFKSETEAKKFIKIVADAYTPKEGMEEAARDFKLGITRKLSNPSENNQMACAKEAQIAPQHA